VYHKQEAQLSHQPHITLEVAKRILCNHTIHKKAVLEQTTPCKAKVVYPRDWTQKFN